uniref:Reverse transcriptase/retrotransposon-derived protein RNase H-like domain-containing protein n=1 Tax=Phlebotomus papatasi TaxID=29031 RepID=A0A1B0DI95_PHLPP
MVPCTSDGVFSILLLTVAPSLEVRDLLLRRLMVNWPWTEVEQAAFEDLKSRLRNQPVLTAYDREATHEIHCDACSKGIAGILIQRKGEDQQAVAYYSRATSDAESRYHSYELETIAVMESLIRFKFYVMGKKITVVTDCKSLVETYKKKDIDPKVSRYWLKMLDYEFDIKYRKKEMMTHADALSRCPVGGKEILNLQAGNVMAIRKVNEIDWIRSLQMQDDDIKHIVDIIRGEVKDKEKKKIYNHDYTIKEEKLYRRVNGKDDIRITRQGKKMKIEIVEEQRKKDGKPEK